MMNQDDCKAKSISINKEIAFRRNLRQSMLDRRRALDPVEHARLSAQICSHLTKWLQDGQVGREKQAKLNRPVVAFYWPIHNEADIRPVAHAYWQCSGETMLPVAVPDEPLQFRRWQADSVFETDCYGIPVPRCDEPAVSVMPDIILLPVLAIDRQGYRLGYGGGFFDRTLAVCRTQAVRPLAIGVGFEFNRIDSICPQAHDIPLDGWLTEAGLMWKDR